MKYDKDRKEIILDKELNKMDAKDVEVDLDELRKFKEQNAKERLEFIDFWVNYIKTHSDKEWNSQQKVLIDAQIGE